jgi:regulator of replication initiation timing
MDLIKFENGQLTQSAVDFIVNIETQMKTLKQQYDDFKSNLLNAMEQNGIVKFEADNLKISYIGETERETFDSKQFKEDMPDLYDEYVKFSKVKPSVRIKVD